MKENTISRVMREMGAKGGKRRLETMTPEQRTEIAKKAAAASVAARKIKKNARQKTTKKPAAPKE